MSTVYLEAVELASELAPVLQRLMQKDPELARKLKRSSDDLTAHVEESMLARGRLRRHELRAAESALKELEACLRAAESVGYLSARPLPLEARLRSLRERLVGAGSERAQAS